jgi:GNAT superfamily N-acetyltransferase
MIMVSPDFKLRKATLEDLPILLDFEQELIKAERPFDVTLKEDPISYYDLKQIIQDENSCVLVVETKGQVIASGYAVPKKARHYLDHEYYAYLGFMFTHVDLRGKGLNARIVEELKDWSKSNGYKEVRLTVYEDNIPAIKAYEKVGFEKHLIEMRLA